MSLSRPATLAALGFLLTAPALAQTAAPSTIAKPPGATTAPAPSTAPATQPSAAQAVQHERMTACNAEAGQKKLSGDKRKSFMADCLAGKPAASAATPAAPALAKPAATTTAPAQAGLLDINSASKEQLDALPQIGSARAEAIIKGRPYKAKRDLVDRKIIPESAYKAIQYKIVARQKS